MNIGALIGKRQGLIMLGIGMIFTGITNIYNKENPNKNLEQDIGFIISGASSMLMGLVKRIEGKKEILSELNINRQHQGFAQPIQYVNTFSNLGNISMIVLYITSSILNLFSISFIQSSTNKAYILIDVVIIFSIVKILLNSIKIIVGTKFNDIVNWISLILHIIITIILIYSQNKLFNEDNSQDETIPITEHYPILKVVVIIIGIDILLNMLGSIYTINKIFMNITKNYYIKNY